MSKAKRNDVAVHVWASGLMGNLVTVDNQLLTLLDQLVTMRVLEAWEDREPSQRHYTLGKRATDIAAKISASAAQAQIKK